MAEIKNEMKVEEYARKILAEHNCNEYTYWGTEGERIIRDLKEAYPNGMEYSYVQVANAIMRISKPKMIERKPFSVVWDTDSFSDGMYCDSFEEAKDDAFETLIQWMCDEQSEWHGKKPTKKEKEKWDYMIYNSISYVTKYNEDTDEYDEYWYPSDEELAEIGWKAYDE